MSSSGSGTVLPFLRRNLALWNVTNYRVTDSPHCMASFTIPGLSHESFDIDANAKITSVMITSVLSRAYALHKPDTVTENTFLDWPVVMNGKYTFVSSTEFRISQELYNPDIPKWPLDAKFSLGNVGNSSVANVIEFFAHEDGKSPLWTNVTQLVAIDTSTRKPTALPEWFKDKYKGKGCLEKGFIIKAFNRPPVTYVHPVKVNWSDTDNYKHTNFASYVRFALDCLHAAVRAEMESDSKKRLADTSKDQQSSDKSRLSSEKVASHDTKMNVEQLSSDKKVSNIKNDSSDYNKEQANGNDLTSNKPLQGICKEKIANGLKNVQICYLSESLEGQTLNVHVWQQVGLEYVVWCAVERDSKDICQIKLEYFDTPRHSNSN
uniref:Uncharacterized protein n=1 Tax=Arion vulgaris TaxID=1028688 RepID=A0A0B6ZLL4_9EUPU